MNSDELFTVIATAGYTLGNMLQTPYVQGGETRVHAWSAHFHDAKGQWIKGFGRSPRDALADVVKKLPLPGVLENNYDPEEGIGALL